jgi:hypothetical protein
MKHILTAALLTLVITAALVAQRAGPATRPPAGAPTTQGGALNASTPAALPPVLMTCVHHPDVLETKPGTCPYCNLPLVPVRLDSAWMCPVHTTVTEPEAGTCRICGRRLVPVTVSLTWTCAADRATDYVEPGTCADGSVRTMHRTLRAHGNHNPQHGGQFFMAPDNWHHLEGVHPSARVFRLYLYDDYGRPLPAATMKAVQARVVTQETFNAATRTTKEVTAFPLKPAAQRPYLVANITPRTLPAEMTAKVRFGRDQPEYRFDFTFASFSKEPVAARAAQLGTRSSTKAVDGRGSGRASVRQPRSPSTPPTPGAAAVAAASLDPLTPVPIPSSMTEMLAQLEVRTRQVGELIARGDFSAVWVPAFQAKDIAIALEPHLAHLSADKRIAGEPALTRVVRTAWLLDAAGDVGNRTQIEAAHRAFTAAVADVLAAFEGMQ